VRAEVFVVSDGTGETASEVVRAAMAQFQSPWRLRTFAETRSAAQARRVVSAAAQAGALLVFTLVDKQLAGVLREEAAEHGVPVVDVLGPVIARVGEHLRAEPRGEPGLLHGFSDAYFKRVEAVEFAVRHDDGANLHTLFRADLVLTGVSRTSKTPLSIFLAERGLRTGNVPILPGIEPPRELFDLDPRKVVGLLASAQTLVDVRRARVRALGVSPYTSYADPEVVEEELRYARRLFRERGWRTVDITGRAVEENAARVLELLEPARGASG
jgi:regulator of PEP synthase PpsR (kinase-PPPase family)